MMKESTKKRLKRVWGWPWLVILGYAYMVVGCMFYQGVLPIEWLGASANEELTLTLTVGQEVTATVITPELIALAVFVGAGLYTHHIVVIVDYVCAPLIKDIKGFVRRLLARRKKK